MCFQSPVAMSAPHPLNWIVMFPSILSLWYCTLIKFWANITSRSYFQVLSTSNKLTKDQVYSWLKNSLNFTPELFVQYLRTNSVVNPKVCELNHRITEYPELERIHKDHWVKLVAPHRATQNSNLMPERIAQMVLEFH